MSMTSKTKSSLEISSVEADSAELCITELPAMALQHHEYFHYQ